MLDGNDVFRHTHSPRSLSKSIVARYAAVSYLNTGSGLSGGHVPARMDFISDCCRAEASPAILALMEPMIPPTNFSRRRTSAGGGQPCAVNQHDSRKLVSIPIPNFFRSIAGGTIPGPVRPCLGCLGCGRLAAVSNNYFSFKPLTRRVTSGCRLQAFV